MAQTEAAVLRVEELSVSYGIVSALKNVTLEVQEGELVALIGANGAGKSTFLATILGINRPREGRITFLGEDITHKPTERIVAGGIFLCPEGRGILPQMSVAENLLLGAYHNRRAINEGFARVFKLFPILAERRSQTAATLSGGQQQMLAIGRALMASPKLLMLDEPSLGLAPLVVNEVLEIVAQLAGEGYTVLLSEQNAKKALQYASRAYVFETGKVVLEGTPEELMANEAVIQAYLGG